MDQENYGHQGDTPNGQNIPPNNTPPRMPDPPFQEGRNPGGQNPGNASENGFGKAALILGILSLGLSCMPYFSIPLGALGVIFALLSKGSGSMSPTSKTGLGICVTGATLGFIMIIVVLFSNTLYQGRNFEEFYQEYMDYYNGGSQSQDQDEAPNRQNQEQQDMEKYLYRYFNGGSGDSGGDNMPRIKENPGRRTIPIPDDVV